MMIAAGDPTSFGDGLDLARRLLGFFVVLDPVLLRSAAASLEARASTSLEFGCAAGLRLAADDEEDDLDVERAPLNVRAFP